MGEIVGLIATPIKVECRPPRQDAKASCFGRSTADGLSHHHSMYRITTRISIQLVTQALSPASGHHNVGSCSSCRLAVVAQQVVYVLARRQIMM